MQQRVKFIKKSTMKNVSYLILHISHCLFSSFFQGLFYMVFETLNNREKLWYFISCYTCTINHGNTHDYIIVQVVKHAYFAIFYKPLYWASLICYIPIGKSLAIFYENFYM